MTIERDRVDGLLARGRLSGPARERILHAVLRDADPVHPPWYSRAFARRLFVWGSPALAGAAIAAIALTMRAPPADMREKGSAVAGALVSLECTQGEPNACSRDGMLLFRVEAVRERSYLAAYAQPLDGGERIWFFPSDAGSDEPLVEKGGEPQVLPRGVKVRSLPEGRYEVRVVLCPRRLSREEAIASRDAGVRGVTVESLPLTVGP
jgi:hypothetical protein